MRYHMMAFLMGVILDFIVGDPMNFPHPIRLIGRLISFFDKQFLGDISENRNPEIAETKTKANEKAKGFVMVILVVLITGLTVTAILALAYKNSPFAGAIVEAILTCYCLAAKSLKVESMKVYKALKEGTLEDARKAVSMIVGRDTESLDEKGVIRAAVETVAENTSDGVIAPLIYTFVGGPILGLVYKSINTMDSMVGYHNDRYENFGFAAAKLDDIVNFIPARISALFMIGAAFIAGKEYSGKDALRVFKRDRYNHKSPNSAQTESACAGALGLRLAGDAYYFGKLVHKPYIGDPVRTEEPEDIPRSCKLMYMTSILTTIFLLVIGVIL